ncbi:hypothetical protein TNCV_1114591 [Trichonephila clavipes]|nr:hypothetical protein TNCV_1114591 [Trichonephila clavipes]
MCLINSSDVRKKSLLHSRAAGLDDPRLIGLKRARRIKRIKVQPLLGLGCPLKQQEALGNGIHSFGTRSNGEDNLISITLLTSIPHKLNDLATTVIQID